MLDRGAAAARSGELAARSGSVMAERGRVSAQRVERRQMLERTGRRGTAAGRAASDTRLALRAAELGFAEVGDYPADRHSAGWSVARISAELGVAREKTTRLLEGLGLPGALDAAHPVEVAALRRVGAVDMSEFLMAQHADGAPVAVTARALGHSTGWLAARARRGGLADLLIPAPTAEQRIEAVVRDGGFAGVGAYLAHRRAAGANSTVLQAETGLAPHRLAELLRAAGAGGTTAVYERRLVEGVGFPDLPGYAHARVAQGWTVLRMSRELGCSDTWLARRLRRHGLDHLIGPTGRNSLRARPADPRPGQGGSQDQGGPVEQ